MTYTKAGNAIPFVKAKISGWRLAIGPATLGPGTSSLIMIPVTDHGRPQPAALPVREISRHHYRARPHALPVDGKSILPVASLLAAYGVLVVLLISTSSRPTPVHHAQEIEAVRPNTNSTPPSERTQTASAAPILPLAAAKPVTPLPLESAAQPVTKAASQLPARREKALDLLKKARESQADDVVYRQMLAELVRSYADTPAGAEALNLLAAAEPANRTNPPAAEPREDAPDVKKSDEKSTPPVRYGLGMMN